MQDVNHVTTNKETWMQDVSHVTTNKGRHHMLYTHLKLLR